ncbi:MAG: SGNH/GDSL hydrolase family protein [Spirulinaceae cyanobacterium]
MSILQRWRWLPLTFIGCLSASLAWLRPTQVAQGPLLLPSLSASNSAPTPPLPPSLAGIETIVLLGDSITELGGEPGGYVWLLEQTLQRLYPQQTWQVINAGVSGDTSTDLRDRFRADVLAHEPQLLILKIGVNDVWHRFYDFQRNQAIPTGDFPGGVELAAYQANLTAMLEQAQTAGIQVLLLSPTPIREVPGPENAALQGYIAAMQRLAAEYDAEFVNLYEPFQGAIAAYHQAAGPAAWLLTYDGVHPNPAGNQLIAHQLLQALGIPESALQAVRLQPCVGMCN